MCVEASAASAGARPTLLWPTLTGDARHGDNVWDGSIDQGTEQNDSMESSNYRVHREKYWNNIMYLIFILSSLRWQCCAFYLLLREIASD